MHCRPAGCEPAQAPHSLDARQLHRRRLDDADAAAHDAQRAIGTHARAGHHLRAPRWGCGVRAVWWHTAVQPCLLPRARGSGAPRRGCLSGGCLSGGGRAQRSRRLAEVLTRGASNLSQALTCPCPCLSRSTTAKSVMGPRFVTLSSTSTYESGAPTGSGGVLCSLRALREGARQGKRVARQQSCGRQGLGSGSGSGLGRARAQAISLPAPSPSPPRYLHPSPPILPDEL